MENKRIVFYSYIKKSKTLLTLKETFVNSIIVKHNEKDFIPQDNDVIVFWGTHRIPEWYNDTVEKNKVIIINSPHSIKVASNKLLTFINLKQSEILIPDFTIDKDVANASFERPFIARKILNGSHGRGIEVVKGDTDTPAARLYVRYINKEKEYRVHVFLDKIVKCSRKIARSSVDIHDEFVWSHDNGYYFNKVKTNTRASKLAIEAIKSLKLDFGAVDIVMKNNIYYVLEVNTAPGLQGQSIEVYKKEIKKLIENKEK